MIMYAFDTKQFLMQSELIERNIIPIHSRKCLSTTNSTIKKPCQECFVAGRTTAHFHNQNPNFFRANVQQEDIQDSSSKWP